MQHHIIKQQEVNTQRVTGLRGTGAGVRWGQGTADRGREMGDGLLSLLLELHACLAAPEKLQVS